AGPAGGVQRPGPPRRRARVPVHAGSPALHDRVGMLVGTGGRGAAAGDGHPPVPAGRRRPGRAGRGPAPARAGGRAGGAGGRGAARDPAPPPRAGTEPDSTLDMPIASAAAAPVAATPAAASRFRRRGGAGLAGLAGLGGGSVSARVKLAAGEAASGPRSRL